MLPAHEVSDECKCQSQNMNVYFGSVSVPITKSKISLYFVLAKVFLNGQTLAVSRDV